MKEIKLRHKKSSGKCPTVTDKFNFTKHKSKMKANHILKHLAAVTILFAIFSIRSVAADSETETNFIAAFKSAFQAKDVDKFLALECWDGFTDVEADKARQNAKFFISGLMKYPLVNAELITTAPKTVMPVNDTNGVIHKFNLKVTKELKVTIEKKSKNMPILFFVGEKDGKLLFANAK